MFELWRVFRRDAIEVLSDERARRTLARYFDVMENKRPAKFMIARRIPVDISLEEGEKALWEEHNRLMEEFRKLEIEIDSGKIDLEDLDEPEISLLDLKIELARRMLKSCEMCERKCRVNRYEKRGFCGIGVEPEISSEFVHIGEEAALVPSHTVFFCGCTFYCVFCQNYTIARRYEIGFYLEPEELAKIIDKRRRLEGTRNVNWVGGEPTPNLHYILEVLRNCKENIPSIWNSNMYMSEKTMRILDGTMDVYLADFKYGNNSCAEKYSKVKRYWEVVTRNHILARKQAEVIIRHLVMPNHVECCTKPILEWIADNLDNRVWINIMGQYRPEFKALEYEEIARRPTVNEMSRAFEYARRLGLENLES